MSPPSSELTVATTSWMPDFCSRFGELLGDLLLRRLGDDIRLIDDAAGERRKRQRIGQRHRAEKRGGSRGSRRALQDASKALARSGIIPTASGASRLRISRLELHLRRRLGVIIGGKFRQRLVIAEDGRGPENAGEGDERRIILPHRLDIIAARDGDTVLPCLRAGIAAPGSSGSTSDRDNFR